MVMSSATADCGFCHEQFDEGIRCPRVLRCSHTLCNHCIGQLIKNDIKVCPLCRGEFQASSPSDIRENETILQDIRKANKRKQSVKRRQNTSFAPAAKRPRQMDESHVDSKSKQSLLYTELQEQIKHIMDGISSLEGDITHGSNNIRQNILPEIYKTISQNDEMQAELKDMNKKLLNKARRIGISHNRLYGDEASDVSDDSDVTEATGITSDEWIRNCKRNLEEDEIYLRTLSEETKKTSLKTEALTDVLHSKATGEVGKRTPPKFALNIQQNNIAGYITVEALGEMIGPIKNLVEAGMIYAVQDHNDKRNYAKISLLDGQYLCLNHLTEDVPAGKVFILEHEEVLKIVSDKSRMAFLELRSVNSRKYLGTLIIRLADNSKRSQNFWMMCSGMKGSSYVDSRLLEVSDKGEDTEHVGFGDYEGNDGYGGKAVVPGAGNESGGHLKQRWLAGIVTGEDCYGGDETAAQFKIFTRDRPQVTLDLAFGSVVKGLPSLTKAISRYSAINNVHVSECGIIVKSL